MVEAFIFYDNSNGIVVGMDTIPFNYSCHITNIYLVEGPKYNLSFSQLYELDLEVHFRKVGCIIEDIFGKDILLCSKDKNLYVLDIQDPT